MFTSQVNQLITDLGLSVLSYADDTQLYITVGSEKLNQSEALVRLQKAAELVRNWYVCNGLQLNSDKSEVMLFGSPKSLSSADLQTVQLLGTGLSTNHETIRSLGVLRDAQLSFSAQTHAVTKSCFFFIHKLWQLRRYIDKTMALTLGLALVQSRLDYCNSLYHNAKKLDIDKLQNVQKALARFVFGVHSKQHSSQLLRSLHILPMHSRIQYKLLTLTRRAVVENTPLYLSNEISLTSANTHRCLRSSDSGKLTLPRVNTNAGKTSFHFSAPSLWNSLPSSIRDPSLSYTTFKNRLKTHLFSAAYPDN